MQIAGDQSRHVLPLTSRYPAVRRSRTPDQRGNATARSASPSRICHPAGSGRAAGHWTGCRITWRPACPALSWSVMRGPNRPSRSRRRSARVPCRSCWCTATWRSCDRRTMPPGRAPYAVAAILAAAWRVTSAVMSAAREQAGAAGRIIECDNTPHSGCGDTQRPAGTFPAQALTTRRGGGRTRCTMNQAGAARLLAVVVLVALAAQHLAGHPTWRGFGEFATMSGWPQPTWRRTRGMVCTRTRPGPAPGVAPCGRPGSRRAPSAR